MIKPPTGRLVGHARVSTEEQDTAARLDALRAAGRAPIYEERSSPEPPC